MRKGSLSLKIKGKDTLNGYIKRLTYTEAVGELDGMTATIFIPPPKEKDFIPLFDPGLPFEIEILDDKGSPVGKREGDVVAVLVLNECGVLIQYGGVHEL